MHGNKTALALLTAAIVGSGLIACQRASEEQPAGSQGSAAPQSQTPQQQQGFTGPATPSSPSGGSAQERSGQAADPATSLNDPTKPMAQPGDTEQEKPAR